MLVERGFVVSLDANFRHHRKGDVVRGRAELLDLLIGAGLLLTEVVGGEADDDQALFLVLFVDRFQAFVLRRVAALAGDVNDQDDLALVIG